MTLNPSKVWVEGSNPFARMKLSKRRKKGQEKDRYPLREAAGFVERFRSQMVLSGNVAGIKRAKDGGVWGDFRTSLEALGYVTGTQVFCTLNFGIPQFRKRSILVAVRREIVRPENLADITGRPVAIAPVPSDPASGGAATGGDLWIALALVAGGQVLGGFAMGLESAEWPTRSDDREKTSLP